MGHLKLTRRTGFTMIELLTVMAVIALMTTLLVGASFRFVVGAREAATATTIMKANGIIQDRVREFQEFDFSQTGMELANRLNISNGLAQVLARKARFKRSFPQAFAEMDLNQQIRFFGTAVPPAGSQYNSKYESGIVLYALLQNGETFGAPTPSNDTFTGAEIKNSPETGNLPCLVDSWGEPLRFYRWPTRLIRPGEASTGDYNSNLSLTDPPGSINLTTGAMQASPPIRPTGTLRSPTPASLLITNLPPFDISSPYSMGPDGAKGIYGASSPANTLGWPYSDDPEYLNSDPDDPTLRLATEWFSTTANAIAFVVGTPSLGYVDAYHDPFTFSSPLIVSAGSDKKLGLYEPNDIPNAAHPQSANFGYLAAPFNWPSNISDCFDNITNLNQRAGGK